MIAHAPSEHAGNNGILIVVVATALFVGLLWLANWRAGRRGEPAPTAQSERGERGGGGDEVVAERVGDGSLGDLSVAHVEPPEEAGVAQ